jgi:iron complex transport system substrate-binding protein
LKRPLTVLAVVFVAVIIVAVTYGAYTLLPSATPLSPTIVPSTGPTEQPTLAPSASPPSATNSPTHTSTPTSSPTVSPTPIPTAIMSPQNETLTVTDGTGAVVTLTLPLQRIVTLNGGLAEIIYALGGGDKIVGRSSTTTYPPAIMNVSVVGSSSSAPTMELVLEANPDVVVADGMLSSQTAYLEQFKNAGIPVIIDSPTNNSRLGIIVTYFGQMLGAEAKATEFLNWKDHYLNLVSDRLANVSLNQRPFVYIEVLSGLWRTGNANSAYGSLVITAGGQNIAPLNSSSTMPTLSPEYVVEHNPDIIFRMVTQSPVGNLTDLQVVRTELMGRTVLQEVTAIKTGHVYVFNSKFSQGLLYPVGILYLAKWTYPDLFADINPHEIHQALIQQFFGLPLDGVYAYPEIS